MSSSEPVIYPSTEWTANDYSNIITIGAAAVSSVLLVFFKSRCRTINGAQCPNAGVESGIAAAPHGEVWDFIVSCSSAPHIGRAGLLRGSFAGPATAQPPLSRARWPFASSP